MDGMTPERSQRELMRLSFPSAYPPCTKDRYEPSTAIDQYSVGRSRILGLSDDGKVWAWCSFREPARYVSLGEARVTKVVAGWSEIVSAYVSGVGIVYWTQTHQITLPDQDGIDVGGSVPTDVMYSTVPGTKYKSSSSRRTSQQSLDAKVGEVVNWLLLEHFLIFITDLHKIYIWSLLEEDSLTLEPTELTSLYAHMSEGHHIKDIQGSFRQFAVFTDKGAVLVCDTEAHLPSYLSCITEEGDASSTLPPIQPAPLQNTSVISLAFGDYHYHGLHSNGTVSS